MNRLLVSNENENIVKSLNSLGFNVISSEYLDSILPFESRHSDMQCLKIDNTFFVAKNCLKLINALRQIGCKVFVTEKEIKKDYPDNIILNALYINKKLYCKVSALDNSVKKYCKEHEIEIINVNQGYAKCSTAVINNIFITADRGIFETLQSNGVEGLLIKSGDIMLPGCDYGFIGGCCFEYDGKAFFTGNLNIYSEGKEIIEFLNKYNIEYVCLTEDKLYDIGGCIVI